MKPVNLKIESLIGLIVITVLVIFLKECDKAEEARESQADESICREYRSTAKKLKCLEMVREEK